MYLTELFKSTTIPKSDFHDHTSLVPYWEYVNMFYRSFFGYCNGLLRIYIFSFFSFRPNDTKRLHGLSRCTLREHGNVHYYNMFPVQSLMSRFNLGKNTFGFTMKIRSHAWGGFLREAIDGRGMGKLLRALMSIVCARRVSQRSIIINRRSRDERGGLGETPHLPLQYHPVLEATTRSI